MIGDAAHIFPAEDGLFEETFSTDNTYRVHGLNITIHQDYSASLGVAASVWDSALHLCQFFENESLDLSGTRIIELGGGTGLVGIVAARLERNIAANTPFSGWPSDGPSVSALAWGLDHSRFSSSWDFVLGADIVYLPETFPLLLDTLVHLCRDGAVVYLASTMRREHGAQDFYDHMLPQMFSVELVQRDPENNINIYKATLR
ncbi:protein-lysine methyltransferase METTL21B-like isoform X3 [Sinocyclocheilus grahami]|uniref:protein-lysine methyltransferase METTL21B isoform X3 n=1 Tax=Sinocyclocheilus grahami TaxID=75366 RepID=UPI0007AD14A0|nr:PREDICTED: protein-lysine methyltransferase METTL21B isoform X3 [Sinocyclocheilus grahami]XP_016109237.1 PREDICTED: protein-lysine methyltransferase METTL21B-like isoform X3 [Sinocyclocheilus grahami]